MSATTTAPPSRRRALVRVGTPSAIETAVFALSLATGPVLSRSLGDDGRGSLAAVVVPVQLAGWAFTAGIPYASSMLSRTVDRRRLFDGAWTGSALIALPVCLVLFLVAPILLDGHPGLTVGWFRFGLLGIVFGLPAGTALSLYLVTRGASWTHSVAKALHMLGYSFSVIALALVGRVTLGSALAAWLLWFIAAPLVVIATLGVGPRRVLDRSVLRLQLATGRMQAAASVATISLGRVDQVVMAAMRAPAELGHYAVAATAAQVSLPFAKGIGDVVLPRAFHTNQAPGEESVDPGRFAVVVFATSAAVGIVSAIAAPWLIPAVFGSDFDASVRLVLFLIPGQVLFNTAWVVSAHHFGRGRPQVAARGLMAAAALNLVGIVPAIAWFGAEGAAALTSICQAVYFGAVVGRRPARAE